MMKPPAALFYWDDFYSGTRDMSGDELACYIRLLCYQWTKGEIQESKRDKLERWTGFDWELISVVLDEKFQSTGGGWRNERLEQVRLEQAEYRNAKSKAGKLGAKKRWQSHESANSKAMAQPLANAMANDSSPSPSPSPRRIDIDHEKLSEVKQLASEVASRVGVKSDGDRVLCWRAACLVVSGEYPENWLQDSLAAVKATKPRKPGAYLTKCLREKATEYGLDFKGDGKRCPPCPEPDSRAPPRRKLAKSVTDPDALAKDALKRALQEVG